MQRDEAGARDDGCGSEAKGLKARRKRGFGDVGEDGNESDDGDKPTDVIELTWHERIATSDAWSDARTKLEEGVSDNRSDEDRFGVGDDVVNSSGLGVLESKFEGCHMRLGSNVG